MNSRKLLILSVGALVVIAAGLWLASAQFSTRSGDSYAALYPALEQQLDSITAIHLFKPGDTRAVELARKDSGWTVTERAGYPADQSKLHKLLLGISDAKLYEEKTSNPDNYASLGVEDVSSPDASGVRIELVGTKEPVDLIVGKPAGSAKSQYVRRAGEPQSWLIDASIDTSIAPEAWVRKEIIDISANRIQSASVRADGGKDYAAAKNSRTDADFAVEGLPKGKEISSPSAANGLATALVGLTLADVQPASAFEGVPPQGHATLKTFDGLVAELDGWTRDEKHFIAVKTSFDPSQAERFEVETKPAKPGAEPAAAAADAKAAPAQPPEDAKAPQADVGKEAKDLGTKLAGWVYEIPEYKYDAIFKPLEELLASQ